MSAQGFSIKNKSKDRPLAALVIVVGYSVPSVVIIVEEIVTLVIVAGPPASGV